MKKKILICLIFIASFFILKVPVLAGGSFINGPASLNTGLLDFWKMDEGSGTSVEDSMGNYAGAASGTGVTSGITGNARSFNGGSDYVYSVNGSPNTGTSTWSLTAWIKPSSWPSTGMVVYNGNDSGGYGFGLSGARLMGLYGGVIWLDSAYNFASLNQWYHVAMTRDGSITRLYVNGNPTPNATWGGYVSNAIQNKFSIGGQYDGGNNPYRFFPGAVDEVGLWNRALTQAEIGALYNSGSGNAFSVPNCYNLSGPATINLGSSGTYKANFTSPISANLNTSFDVGQNGTFIWNSGYQYQATARSVTWTPTATGTYDLFCRAWNDGIAECRGKSNYVDGPPRYTCLGPTSSMTVTVNPSPTPTPTPPPVNACSGAVSYFKMDETTGTNVADAVGANNGTATGTTIVTPGKMGAAARSFNGTTGSYVTVPLILSGSTSKTISAWVYIPSTSVHGAFIKVGGANGNGYAIGVGNSSFDDGGNQLYLLYEMVRWIPTGRAIGTGWHHVAMTIDASGIPTAYLDGVPSGPYGGAGPVAPSGNTVIGADPITGSRFFNGYVDEAGFWNRILSQAEIQASMTNSCGNPPKTCSINSVTPGTSVTQGTGLTVNYSGNNNNNTSGSDTVKLWLEKWPNNSVALPSPYPGTQVAGYYYTQSTCISNGSTPCSTSVPIVTSNLPAGDYYLHCDVGSLPNNCSGNPYCTYEGLGGGSVCNGWISCSNNDNQKITIASPTPTPTPTPTPVPTATPHASPTGNPGVASTGRLSFQNMGFWDISSRGWNVTSDSITDFGQNNLKYDYNYYYNKLAIIPGTTPSFDGHAPSSNGIYFSNGSIVNLKTPNNWTDLCLKAVVVINGNLNIDKQITVKPPNSAGCASGGFLAFIVSGDITVDKVLGNTNAQYGTSNAEGIYIANGKIDIQLGNPPNNQFVGRGMFIADADLDGKDASGFNNQGFAFGRDLGATDNQQYPAQLFEYRPDFLFNFPDLMGKKSITWREVAP